MKFWKAIDPTRTKTLIRFSTENARKMVRTVLEPHPALGLRIQDIYAQVHKQFPDAREKPEYIPKDSRVPYEIPNPYHPLRSMRYLKCTVMDEMEKLGEVHQIYIRSGSRDKDGVRMDLVKYKEGVVALATDAKAKQEWRWRLTPSYVPTELPDPSVGLLIKAQSATKPAGWHGMGKRSKKRIRQEKKDVQLENYGRILA